MVVPWFTLMSVENPCKAELLGLDESQAVLPGRVFSQATGLTTGASQGAAAACCAGRSTSGTSPRQSASRQDTTRRRPPSADNADWTFTTAPASRNTTP